MTASEPLLPCKACGEGALHPKVGMDTVVFDGKSVEVRHYYSVCDTCGAELDDARQAMNNKQEFQKFRNALAG